MDSSRLHNNCAFLFHNASIVIDISLTCSSKGRLCLLALCSSALLSTLHNGSCRKQLTYGRGI